VAKCCVVGFPDEKATAYLAITKTLFGGSCMNNLVDQMTASVGWEEPVSLVTMSPLLFLDDVVQTS
jgi:hypothetical protein